MIFRLVSALTIFLSLAAFETAAPAELSSRDKVEALVRAWSTTIDPSSAVSVHQQRVDWFVHTFDIPWSYFSPGQRAEWQSAIFDSILAPRNSPLDPVRLQVASDPRAIEILHQYLRSNGARIFKVLSASAELSQALAKTPHDAQLALHGLFMASTIVFVTGGGVVALNYGACGLLLGGVPLGVVLTYKTYSLARIIGFRLKIRWGLARLRRIKVADLSSTSQKR